jgi:MFS transporter, ACS family, D-galactonate transporter
MLETPAANPASVAARWRIVGLLMAYAAIGHFNRVGISVVGSEVFIPEFGISETRMGWVYTAFLIFYTIGMLPGGWLIDRIGAGRSMTAFGVTMGVFVALTGTLGWITNDAATLWIGLLVIRSLAGVGNAPLHPGAAHVVSDLMSNRRRATANGMITAGALVGIACCYPVFGWLVDRLGWPLAFVAGGFALIAFGAFWHAFASPALPPPHSTPPAVDDESDPRAVRWLLRHRSLWLITVSYAAFGYFQYLFFYWMNYYFESVLHVPRVESRQASFYIMLAMAAGMTIGGLSADAICHRLGTNLGRRGVVMAGMGLGALFALIGVNVTGQGNVTACLAISMGALGMCEGVFWTTATDIGGRARGFAAAFMNTGGNIGGLISPVLTPFMAESMGWPAAIAVACLISGTGGLLWFLIKLPDTHAAHARSVNA